MKQHLFSEPKDVSIGGFLFNERKENIFIYRCKKILYIELKIMRPRAAILGDLSQKTLQSQYGGMSAFVLSAGVGIVDKDGFIYTLQIIY